MQHACRCKQTSPKQSDNQENYSKHLQPACSTALHAVGAVCHTHNSNRVAPACTDRHRTTRQLRANATCVRTRPATRKRQGYHWRKTHKERCAQSHACIVHCRTRRMAFCQHKRRDRIPVTTAHRPGRAQSTPATTAGGGRTRCQGSSMHLGVETCPYALV
jgi:hypothetical protein